MDMLYQEFIFAIRGQLFVKQRIYPTKIKRILQLAAAATDKLLLHSRCLMVSTDQADPSCFYFRIS